MLGLCLFTVAFFLPAIRVEPGAPPMKGWECATITLTSVIRLETWRSSAFLGALSGLINPLIVLYLIFALIPPFRRSPLSCVRKLTAALIVLCMAATWTFFVMAHIIPLIGHVLWIAGALIILIADLRPRRRIPAVPA